MGSRVIAEVSKIMFDQFVKNFQALLKQPSDAPESQAMATAEPSPINATSLAWKATKGLFRGKS
jgi:hypothetical protein